MSDIQIPEVKSRYANAEMTNPQWADAEKTAIFGMVRYPEHPNKLDQQWILGCVRPDDSEEHIKDLYERCKKGDFGQVKPYVAPVEPVLDAATEARNAVKKLLTQSDWTQLADIADDVKIPYAEYRKKLRELEKQDGFPDKIEWPAEPDIK